jgi:hypothetical protein
MHTTIPSLYLSPPPLSLQSPYLLINSHSSKESFIANYASLSLSFYSASSTFSIEDRVISPILSKSPIYPSSSLALSSSLSPLSLSILDSASPPISPPNKLSPSISLHHLSSQSLGSLSNFKELFTTSHFSHSPNLESNNSSSSLIEERERERDKEKEREKEKDRKKEKDPIPSLSIPPSSLSNPNPSLSLSPSHSPSPSLSVPSISPSLTSLSPSIYDEYSSESDFLDPSPFSPSLSIGQQLSEWHPNRRLHALFQSIITKGILKNRVLSRVERGLYNEKLEKMQQKQNIQNQYGQIGDKEDRQIGQNGQKGDRQTVNSISSSPFSLTLEEQSYLSTPRFLSKSAYIISPLKTAEDRESMGETKNLMGETKNTKEASLSSASSLSNPSSLSPSIRLMEDLIQSHTNKALYLFDPPLSFYARSNYLPAFYPSKPSNCLVPPVYPHSNPNTHTNTTAYLSTPLPSSPYNSSSSSIPSQSFSASLSIPLSSISSTNTFYYTPNIIENTQVMPAYCPINSHANPAI